MSRSVAAMHSSAKSLPAKVALVKLLWLNPVKGRTEAFQLQHALWSVSDENLHQLLIVQEAPAYYCILEVELRSILRVHKTKGRIVTALCHDGASTPPKKTLNHKKHFNVVLPGLYCSPCTCSTTTYNQDIALINVVNQLHHGNASSLNLRLPKGKIPKNFQRLCSAQLLGPVTQSG